MNEKADFPSVDIPAIAVSFKQSLGEKRELGFLGYVSADCPQDVLDGFLDKIVKASERQNAMAYLPSTQSALSQFKTNLTTWTNRLLLAESKLSAHDELMKRLAVESGKREFRQSSQQINARSQIETEIKSCEEQINNVKKEIAEHEREIATYEARIRAEA